MFEALVNLDKLSILQCQKLAQDIGYDGSTFDLCGPKGKLKCTWLDAYFGLFAIENTDGFVMASDFQYAADIHCENLMPPPH